MAINSLTPTDVYSIVNAAAKEMYGGNTTLSAFDTSSFCSVGEQMLRTGYENTLDAISHVLGRTVIDVRPYKGRFFLISSFSDSFAIASRKISFFTKKAEATKDWNTDAAGTQLDDGQSIDHYVISKKYPVELNFTGLKTLQYSYTTFRKQLKIAFQSEASFSEFVAGMLVAIANDIEHIKEAENMLQVVNYAGACVDVTKDENAVMAYNLIREYNEDRGVVKTAADLLKGSDKKDFYEFLICFLQGKIARMGIDSVDNHMIPYKTDDAGNALTLLRHTPSANQRLMFYEPFMRAAKATIMPEIFNDKYLQMANYEGVEYWQNLEVPSSICVEPNYLTQASVSDNRLVSTKGAKVEITNLLGILFDDQALWERFFVQDVITTPVNAKGDYYNTVYHWAAQHNIDLTQKGIVMYADDYFVPATDKVTASGTVLVDTNLDDSDITITVTGTGNDATFADGVLTVTAAVDGKITITGANMPAVEITIDVA